MKRKIISVITTFVLILSSHFSMIYAFDKPNLNLNKKEDSVEVTLNLPEVENGLDAITGNLDYDKNKLELTNIKQVSKDLKTPQYNEANGKFILLINSKTINKSTDVVCFTFKVKNTVTEDTTIKVTELTGATSKDQKITLDDTQTVLSIDKKTNSSNAPTMNNDEKNTNKQNSEKSNQSLNKEETKNETVSANKTDQKTSVTKENKKDTTPNKTESSVDKNSAKSDKTSSSQEIGNKKDSNEKLSIVKKESMRPNILLIFIAVIVLMLLLLITKYRKK